MIGCAIAIALAFAAQEKAPPLDLTHTLEAERIRQLVAADMSAPLPVRRYTGVSPEVVLTPRFLFVRDSALVLPTPPWSDEGAYAAAFKLARDAWYSVQSDRIRLLMVFSTFKEGGGALFYLPLANDVQGLGEGTPAMVFDDAPNLELEGFAWLGKIDVLEDAGPSDAYLKEAFVHEIAHRWTAYAKISHPSLPADILRGRQSMHWSFLASTSNSPMEGNDWTKRPDGLFVTTFDTPPELRFSPLDLYLMGVLAPEEVPPFRVITNWTVVQPLDLSIAKETAPAHRSGRPVVVDAFESAEITIEDVIAGSGPRTPAASDRTVEWPVGIVLLSSGIERTPLESLAHLETKIGELTDDFARATGGRIKLDVRVDGAGTVPFGGLCASVDVCHRTEADRCIALRAGEETTCQRSCTSGDACGTGCCALAADGTTRVCMADPAVCAEQSSPPAPTAGAMDLPTSSSEPSAPMTRTLDARGKGCACIAATAGSRSPVFAFAFLAGLALFSVRRRALPAFLLLAACASKTRPMETAVKAHEPPKLDLERAASYLDMRALDWVNHTPEIGENFKCALSCHTTHAFLAVRAALAPPSTALDDVRKRIEARVLDTADWTSVTPFYGKPGSKLEGPSRGTEAVMNAATLALSDLAAGREASDATLRAYHHMWRMQTTEGAFPWLSFDLEPWESSADFGAAAALLAVGASGEAYRREAANRAAIESLSRYVKGRLEDSARPMAVHDQALILWAGRRLPDLLDPLERAQIADRLRVLEQHDGGWSLATWGRGKRATKDSSAPSDAYATALATIALAEGESTTANGVRRGLEWLAAHQSADGSWPTLSINKDDPQNHRYMTDAATAYAAFALARYR